MIVNEPLVISGSEASEPALRAHNLEGRDALFAQTMTMVANARSRLLIASQRLLPEVYNSPGFVAEVRRLAVRHAHVDLRLLISEPQTLVTYGHRLVDLARRLPSRISLRVAAFDQERLQNVLLVDSDCYITYSDESCCAGTAVYEDRRQAAVLAEQFLGAWEMAGTDPNLRRLQL